MCKEKETFLLFILYIDLTARLRSVFDLLSKAAIFYFLQDSGIKCCTYFIFHNLPRVDKMEGETQKTVAG